MTQAPKEGAPSGSALLSARRGLRAGTPSAYVDEVSTPTEQATDPRTLRTREALRAAVLRLASEKIVDEVSVSELAAAAGVNRSTFYRHAATAAEVLRDALYEDFDAWRASVLEAMPVEGSLHAAWHEAAMRVAEHVERYLGVYERGLGDPNHASAALLRITTSHFEESILQYLQRHPEIMPDDDGSGALSTLGSARFIGSGTVGLIRAWLESPQPRSPQAYADATVRILPPWIFTVPAGGKR